MNLWIVQIPNADNTGAHILGYVAAANPQDAVARGAWVFERPAENLQVAALLFVDGLKVRLEPFPGTAAVSNVIRFPATGGQN